MRISLITFLFLISTLAQAGVYKYYDEEGNLHFSDNPIENKNTEEVKLDPIPKYDAALQEELEKKRRYVEMSEEERSEYEAKQENKKVKRERDDKYCTEANERLQSYKSSSKLVEYDANGKRSAISSEKRIKAIADLEKIIKDNCM